MSNLRVKGYRKAFEKYGVDARALHWVSKKAQELRVKELIKDLDFEKKSVLDVGCGFGDIIPFIQKKAKRFKFTGVDLVPEFLEVARNRYPNYEFLITNYFKNPLEDKFDIVITSGTLNGSIKNALEYRKRAIKTIFEHAKEACAFNMAGGHPQPENKKGYKVYYVDSLEIFEFCLTLTSKIIFRQHYRKRDFTVVMVKNY